MATASNEFVSPLFAEVRAQYGEAFDTALARNVEDALAEDIGSGDQTGRLVPADVRRTARITVREEAVLCGVPWFNEVMRRVDPSIGVEWQYREGDRMAANTPVVLLHGPARALLTAERNGLNFLQLLSGVASATRRFVDAIEGTRSRILDTRKTLPGLRLAQKYAVRVGGGANQRLALYDGILIKENHIAAAGGVGAAMDAALALECGRADPDRSGDAGATGIGAGSSRRIDPARQLQLRRHARRRAHHRRTGGAGSLRRR